MEYIIACAKFNWLYRAVFKRLLKRTPHIADQLWHGEYKSMWAAAIAAGIVKIFTPLDALRKAWKKASAEQRQQFLSEVGNDHPG